MCDQPRPEIRAASPCEVVHDHAPPRDSTHLAQERDRRTGLQVVDEQGCVGHVERPVLIGERGAVPDVKLEPVRRREAWVGQHGRGQDLGSVVDADHAEPPAAPPPGLDQGERYVGATRSHVEQAHIVAVGGQRLEGPNRQGDTTQSPIEPPQIAQVAHERRSIVERPVESLLHPGQAPHTRRLPHDHGPLASPGDGLAEPVRPNAGAIMPAMVSRTDRGLVPVADRAPSSWGLGDGQAIPWEYAPAPEARDIVRLKERYGLFIGGREVPASDGRTFTSVDPATEQPLAEVARATPLDIDKAVRAARRAQRRSWGRLPGKERAKYLFRISRILQERSREFAVL